MSNNGPVLRRRRSTTKITGRPHATLSFLLLSVLLLSVRVPSTVLSSSTDAAQHKTEECAAEDSETCTNADEYDTRTFGDDVLDDLARWLIVSGSRAAFVLVLAPPYYDDGGTILPEYRQFVAEWRTMSVNSRSRPRPSIDFWIADCKFTDQGIGACREFKNIHNGSWNPREPPVLEWMGGKKWAAVAPPFPSWEERQVAFRAAFDRGDTSTFLSHNRNLLPLQLITRMKQITAAARKSRMNAGEQLIIPRVVRPVYWSDELEHQKAELRNAAVIAAATGRSLCVTPFEERFHWKEARRGERNLRDAGPTLFPAAYLYDWVALFNFVPAARREDCPPYDRCVPAFSLCEDRKNTGILFHDAVVSTEEYLVQTTKYNKEQCIGTVSCRGGFAVPLDLHWRLRENLHKPQAMLRAASEWIRGMFKEDSGAISQKETAIGFIALYLPLDEAKCPQVGLEVENCIMTINGPVSVSVINIVQALKAASVAAGGMLNVFLVSDRRRQFVNNVSLERVRSALKTQGFNVRELRDYECDNTCLIRLDQKGNVLQKLYKVGEKTFATELGQQITSLSSFALGPSGSPWFLEALSDMAGRDGDQRAFEIVFEMELALDSALDFSKIDPRRRRNQMQALLPSVYGMDDMKFGFLGQKVRCENMVRDDEAGVATDGSDGVCCRANC